MEENTKIKLTPEGLKKLQKEYDECINVKREQIKKDLELARSQGDLSENADYDAARSAQAENEARIKDLKFKLDNYELITQDKTNDKVTLGSKVTFVNEKTNETRTVVILGEEEQDPANNLISENSPLGVALLDKKVGEDAHVECKNDYHVRVLNISKE